MHKISGSIKIILILFLALALRIGHVIQFDNRPPTAHDGLVFDDIAMNVIENGRFQIGPTSPERRVVFYDIKEGLSSKEPLYPFFLVCIYKVFGHSFIAVRLIEALIGTLTVLLVYIIGIRFFNMNIAYIASFIIATYPPFIEFTGLFLRENSLIFLTSVLIFYLMEISNKESVCYRQYAYVGVLLGLIALSKAAILIFTPFFLAALLFKHKRIKSFIKASVVTFAMMMLVISPWTIRNYLVHHKFIPVASNGGINFLLGNNPKASGTNLAPWPTYSPAQEKMLENLREVDMDRQYFKWGLMYIHQDPLRYFKLAFKKFLIFWFDSYGSYKTPYGFITRIFDAFLLIAGFLGILCSLADWRKYLMAYLFIVSTASVYMIFFVVIRNRFQIIPLLSLFAAYGLITFVSTFTDSKPSIFIKKKKEMILKFLVTGAVGLAYLSYHALRLINKIIFLNQ